MIRTACLTLLAVAAVGSTGCLDEFLDGDGPHSRNKPVEMPAVPEATREVAARVHEIGGAVVGATPFLGIDPTFYTDSRAAPVLGHADLKGVVISEGLVNKCKSDGELAALLASELSRMAAEKHAADRNRPDPPSSTVAGATSRPGSIGAEELPLAETALYHKRPQPTGPPARTDAPVPSAAELLQAAGYEAKALAAVAPLLAEAAGNRKLVAGTARRPAEPQWTP